MIIQDKKVSAKPTKVCIGKVFTRRTLVESGNLTFGILVWCECKGNVENLHFKTNFVIKLFVDVRLQKDFKSKRRNIGGY